MALSISHTAKTIFQRCNKEYWFTYVAGLQRRGETAKPLRMGSAFSDALEEWDTGAVDHWYEQYFDDHPDARFQLGAEAGITRVMAAAYMDTYEQHEREWEIPEQIIGACSFKGYIDGVVEPGVLVEDKFKTMWTPSNELVLGSDDQVTGYVAMYSMHTGIDPSDVTVMYRVTKKPGLKQYKKTKTRPAGESEGEYLARVAADVAANPDKYFIEIPTTRTEDDVVGWWKTTRKVARQIEAEVDKGDDEGWPENRSACVRFNSVCEFYDLCNARTEDEIDVAMMDYEVREER